MSARTAYEDALIDKRAQIADLLALSLRPADVEAAVADAIADYHQAVVYPGRTVANPTPLQRLLQEHAYTAARVIAARELEIEYSVAGPAAAEGRLRQRIRDFAKWEGPGAEALLIAYAAADRAHRNTAPHGEREARMHEISHLARLATIRSRHWKFGG